MKGLILLISLLSIIQFPEVHQLDSNKGQGDHSSDCVLIEIMLSEDEGLVEIYGEDIRINFQKLELDIIVDDLHAIVVV